MDFAPSDRVAALLDRVNEFMEEHVYPVELEALQALDEEVGPGVAVPADPGRDARAREGRGALEPVPARRRARRRPDQLGVRDALRGHGPHGVAPMVFNCSAPDTGNMEILAEHGTRGAEGALAAAAARRRDPLVLLDDRAGDAPAPTRPTSPRAPSSTATSGSINGHKWFTSGAIGAALAIAMVVTEPDAAPHKRASMILVPDRRARLQPAAPGVGDGPRRRPRPLRDQVRGLPRAGRQPARRARRGLRDRAGPARPRPHPPLHARHRRRRARARADVQARGQPRGVRRRRWRRSSSSRTSSRSRASRSTRRG